MRALRREGSGFAPRLALDAARIAIAAVALLVSIPWIAADLGFYLPEGVFIMERPGLEPDGTTIAAVHLGHHHGLDGTLIVAQRAAPLAAAPARDGRLALGARRYVSLALRLRRREPRRRTPGTSSS